MRKFYTSISVDREVAEKAKQAAASHVLVPNFSEVVEAGLRLFIANVDKAEKRKRAKEKAA